VGRKQFLDINHNNIERGRGETLTVAVLDSIYTPEDELFDIVTGVEENYVASKEVLTTPHGQHVLHIISEYAPEAIYDIHRIVIESGEFNPSNYLKAMGNVRDRSVEVVNISAGKHHEDCNQRCRICKAASEVVDSGTIVVAGAGNDAGGGERKSLYCPALGTDTIAIGSYETRCGFDMQQKTGSLYRTVPQSIHPPGAYWSRNSELSPEPEPTNIPFCSRQGCSEFHSCEDYQKERLSDINVSFRQGEPDVFAPDHYIIPCEDGTPRIRTGTSFAAALVSGALADILSSVMNHRPFPTPEEVIEAIHSIPTTVEGTSQRKFNSQAVYQNLL